MTTIARQANIRIANRTTALAQVVINARFAVIVADLAEIGTDEDIDFCELCERHAAAYTRIDNRDGAEVSVCEHCADTADLSHIAD